MNKNLILDRCHRMLGKSQRLVRFAVKIRNQCNRIIGQSFNDGPNIAVNGEGKVINALAKVCFRFMDVGANKGKWSEIAYRAGAKRGILVEPNPTAFDDLTKKWADACDIRIEDWVLSDKSESIPFYYSGDFDVYAGLNVVRAKHIMRSSTTLDEKKEDIDWMKLDVEGSECAILRGSKNLIASGKINYIQFEYNSTWLVAGETLTWMLDYLHKNGFDVFLIKSGGLYIVNHEYFGEHQGYANYLAVRRTHIKYVEQLIVGEK